MDKKTTVTTLQKSPHDPDNRTSATPSDDDPKLGQWYWITEYCRWDNDQKGLKKGDPYRWLGCVMKIGTNYVELHSPHSKENGYSSNRIHFDEFCTRLQLEPNANEVINAKIAQWQQEANRLLEEVRTVCARLGLDPRHYLPGSAASGEGEDPSTTALVAIATQPDMAAYKDALVVAKEKTLPDLFKAIKDANNELCRWMLATVMETRAAISPMEGSIKEIENRIFNVGLYAGLTEDAVQIADGEPAGMTDRLHVMQRRLYMDEECLANYEAGGMEFADIGKFDEWMARPENRDRILPFPRTLVAMRVRRYEKERDHEGSLSTLFVNLRIANSDKFTFFYLRNGEQLFRISCAMEFGEMIFPDRSMFDPGEAKMMKLFGRRVDKIITRSDYEAQLAEHESRQRKHDEWVAEHPGEHVFGSPYYGYSSFRPSEWEPFDPSSVYFDDAMAEVEGQIKEYNRIAIIIQGLFDRSPVLHPHPPVQTWSAEGFDRAIRLVYDAGVTLYQGEKPDFEAYRHKCNESLGSGSVTTGQQLYWLKKEAEKENRRLDSDWRHKNEYRHKTFKPYGNPGPGRVAVVKTWKRGPRTASFEWTRESQRSFQDLRTTITVPASELLNVSAYKPGDFRPFFADPRTRAEYLKWAPLLLSAEDYHAGKLRTGNP